MMWKRRKLPRLLDLLAASANDPVQAAIGNDHLFDLALSQAMSARRRAIKKRSGGRSPARHTRIAAKRFANSQARQLKKQIRRQRTWAIPKNLLVKRRSASVVLDSLDPGRVTRWKPLVARRFRRKPLRVELGTLNFLDDPVGTLQEFGRISRIECEEINAFLDFSDPQCMDVGAFLVLAEIWPQLSKIFRGGRMSLPVQKVLSAIQLDKELNIGLAGVKDHKDVWAFPIRHRRPRGTTTSPTANLRPQDREKVADELCELFDEWLSIAYEQSVEDSMEWELSPEGRSLIMRMSGELLDNAERHSVPGSVDGDWSMTAFMAKRESESGNQQLRCYMSFLNTGQSIAEAMAGAPITVSGKIDRYLNAFGRRGPSRSSLLTVVALQDTVTSDKDASRAQRGGTGLQDVLELVSELGAAAHPNADVRVTIVSGGSAVRLRHPNLVGTRNASGRRVQWCNPWNDPAQPPHPEVVLDLPAHFAGTLVSAAFTLDPRLFVGEASEIDDRRN